MCKNSWTDWHAICIADLGRPKEPCIRCGSRSPQAKGQFLGKGHTQACAMTLNDWDAIWVVNSGGSKEACIRWLAHWHHVANTTEPSICGSNAALLSNYFDHLLLPCLYRISEWLLAVVRVAVIVYHVLLLSQCCFARWQRQSRRGTDACYRNGDRRHAWWCGRLVHRRCPTWRRLWWSCRVVETTDTRLHQSTHH